MFIRMICRYSATTRTMISWAGAVPLHHEFCLTMLLSTENQNHRGWEAMVMEEEAAALALWAWNREISTSMRSAARHCIRLSWWGAWVSFGPR